MDFRWSGFNSQKSPKSGFGAVFGSTRPAAGRDAMDRIANHKTSSVTDVYDRHGYEAEDRQIMAAVARHVTGLVEAEQTSNVVVLR